MAVQNNDMYQLAQDPVFLNRVQAGLILICLTVAAEGWTIPFHRERATFASQILQAPNGATNYIQLFANTVSTDTSCINDATVNGTVPLTATNRAAQALLVTDAHINAAIASEFNSFFRVPAN